MFSIIVERGEKVLLSEALSREGYVLDKPCGGIGICGKCKVIAKGDLSDITMSEKKFLSEHEISSGILLACMTYVTGKAFVELVTNNQIYTSEKTNDGRSRLYAVIDIGTTVIDACFFEMPGLRFIKKLKVKNAQVEYGADVISRINYAKDENGLKSLHDTITMQIKDIMKKSGAIAERCVITGNTTMLHLFSGIDPTPLAQYPFEPPSLFGFWDNNVYLPPCISAYVGADTTTAIMGSGMLKTKPPSLLIDIGTNGEMALYNGNIIQCTSAAAGPAFEGSNISMGMIAAPGAIYRVYQEGTKLHYKTVDDEPPAGVCATGLIDAVSIMIKSGILKNDGYLENKYEIGDSGVFITPQDIRNVQLAKAAIRAGIDILIKKSGICADDIKTVYITGALGSSVNIENCILIGLIPEEIQHNVKTIDNAAIRGAVMILEDESLCDKVVDIAKSAEAFDLSQNDEFNSAFIKNIDF